MSSTTPKFVDQTLGKYVVVDKLKGKLELKCGKGNFVIAELEEDTLIKVPSGCQLTKVRAAVKTFFLSRPTTDDIQEEIDELKIQINPD
ncbi:MAG: hypothetical protein Q9208_008270 [Pyrenodesmia sp. 3 TL-2023]